MLIVTHTSINQNIYHPTLVRVDFCLESAQKLLFSPLILFERTIWTPILSTKFFFLSSSRILHEILLTTAICGYLLSAVKAFGTAPVCTEPSLSPPVVLPVRVTIYCTMSSHFVVTGQIPWSSHVLPANYAHGLSLAVGKALERILKKPKTIYVLQDL